MLAFSRQQYLEPESLYLDLLIPDLLGFLQQVVGDNVTIKTRISNSLHQVFADRGQIDNALFHLAANARDAMPGGGTITISAQNIFIDEQEAANHADAESGSFVYLAVHDDGAGMTSDVAKKAAAPFFTTKDAGRGAGLGLSTVFGFASQSGGFAKIESRAGEGTTVSLYLPQAMDARGFGEAVQSRAEAQTILLVEDEPEVRELVSTFLRGFGYRVIEAGDGRAARAVLEGDERIDLLFSDIAMPYGLNGTQVAEIGRKLRPVLKILFMSGYREDFLIDSGQVMAGVPIIWKPYEKEEMARMVANALKGSTEL
ncbi:MAG: Blue-light-activated protein [Alphaproteobacteria bacterium MarineAlpha10_Bin2]|nr:MAG: Blue-light-activated protein [Alphaproteobacteria bacterium MarineAlpha10_Bin2]